MNVIPQYKDHMDNRMNILLLYISGNHTLSIYPSIVAQKDRIAGNHATTSSHAIINAINPIFFPNASDTQRYWAPGFVQDEPNSAQINAMGMKNIIAASNK